MRINVQRMSVPVALLAVVALCLGISPIAAAARPARAAGTGAGAKRAGTAVGPGLHAGGSVDEAWLTGAGPGDQITLVQHGAPSPTRPIRARPTRSGR